MSNKMLMGALIVASMVIGGLIVSLTEKEAEAQVAANNGRFQLVKGRISNGTLDDLEFTTQTVMVLFDNETGIMSIPVDDDEELAIVSPSSPFQMVPDGRGNMFVLNPDSGSVWRIDKKGEDSQVMEPIRVTVENGIQVDEDIIENNPG